MSRLPKLIVILGPTASGKTDLSLKLAKKFEGEIVNADSRQIYKGMDIGTGKAKPDRKAPLHPPLKKGERGGFIAGGVRHHLTDIVNPDQEFSLADYKKKAVAAIRDILRRGKVPFLVGGAGLYIQAVVDNLEIPAVPPNKKLRAQFEKEIKKPGALAKWYKKLLKLDPGAALTVDKNNPRRIIRALEVCLATGQPFSKLREKGEPLFDVLQIGIDVPREKLYERIDKRVDQMIKQGLVAETKNLIKKFQVFPILSRILDGKAIGTSFPPKADPPLADKFQDLPSMSGIGYKEIGDYLRGDYSLAEAVQEIKYRTHAYARRQMTWFRRDKRIKWIENYKEAERKTGKWLVKS